MTLRGLGRLRPIRELAVCGIDKRRAADIADRHGAAFRIRATVAASARAAARGADIVLVATWSRRPLLDAADVTPGSPATSPEPTSPAKPSCPRT